MKVDTGEEEKKTKTEKKVTVKNSPTFQVKRDKGTCLCSASVLGNQGLVALHSLLLILVNLIIFL